MSTLPKGYYVVRNEEAPEDVFEFRGGTYRLTPGENVFPTLAEAAAAAIEVPSAVLGGLDYDSFTTPVILFTPGKHVPDKFVFEKSLTLLGYGAGISPNVDAQDGSKDPNPLRGENESLLYGSYWNGKMTVTDPSVTEIVFDGFSSYRTRFIDSRTKGGKVGVAFRNMIYVTGCGNNLHTFSNASAEDSVVRSVFFEHVRVKDFDDLDYGGMFVFGNAHEYLFDDLCYDTTGQVFGPATIPGKTNSASVGSETFDFTVRNSYFANLSGAPAIHITSKFPSVHVRLTVENSTFRDACPEGERVIYAEVPGAEPSVRIRACRFENAKKDCALLSVRGEVTDTVIEKCRINGFTDDIEKVAEPAGGAPDHFTFAPGRYESGTEDSHTVINPSEADFSPLDALYEGRSVYWGDQHAHSNSGGTSDGKTPLSEWVARMDEKQVDFAAIVDHRQMRGFFLPEWDDTRFIIGTEPGTRFTDLTAVRCGQAEVHYNMLFPHKYGLAMVLANFPEFEFRGDELTGSFRYPKFTREHFLELAEYVKSIGGIMVHPHPKTMLASDDPLDYYFGEHTFIETIYGNPYTHASIRNYDVWCKILALGKHMYTSSGTDTHGAVANTALSAFYTREKNGLAFFNQFRSGDFTVGNVGIQMCIGDSPMGSEIGPSEEKTLLIRLKDFYAPMFAENNTYELRVITDRGIAFAAQYNGKYPQDVAIEVRDRKFYRAEIFDVTYGVRVAIGNPIWINPSDEPAAE